MCRVLRVVASADPACLCSPCLSFPLSSHWGREDRGSAAALIGGHHSTPCHSAHSLSRTSIHFTHHSGPAEQQHSQGKVGSMLAFCSPRAANKKEGHIDKILDMGSESGRAHTRQDPRPVTVVRPQAPAIQTGSSMGGESISHRGADAAGRFDRPPFRPLARVGVTRKVQLHKPPILLISGAGRRTHMGEPASPSPANMAWRSSSQQSHEAAA